MNKYMLIMMGSALIASISQLLLKKSAIKKHTSFIFEYLNPYVIAGYILLLSTMFVNIIAYRGVEYKTGAILSTLSYVFVMLIGKFFFNEKITREKLIGNLFIIAGIIVFNL